jgi:cysteine desulfurase
VALGVGLGEAARLAGLEWESRRTAALAIRERFLSDLQAVDHHINGDPSLCQPHVMNVSFPGVDSESLMLALRERLAVSNGSACSTSLYRPSHVLQALGMSELRIQSTVRLSWGYQRIGVESRHFAALLDTVKSLSGDD